MASVSAQTIAKPNEAKPLAAAPWAFLWAGAAKALPDQLELSELSKNT